MPCKNVAYCVTTNYDTTLTRPFPVFTAERQYTVQSLPAGTIPSPRSRAPYLAIPRNAQFIKIGMKNFFGSWLDVIIAGNIARLSHSATPFGWEIARRLKFARVITRLKRHKSFSANYDDKDVVNHRNNWPRTASHGTPRDPVYVYDPFNACPLATEGLHTSRSLSSQTHIGRKPIRKSSLSLAATFSHA